MRVLMMIGNDNMAVREVYTSVLQSRFPGWGISHMSGLPPNPAYILKAYDVLIYELAKPDDPRRYKAILELWDELKDLQRVRIVTHIEGPYREGVVAELEGQSVVCVGAPFTPQAIAEALQRVAPPGRTRDRIADGKTPTRRSFLGGIFRRKEPT